MRRMLLIWGNREAKYFSRYIWTTQISLIPFANFNLRARDFRRFRPAEPRGIRCNRTDLPDVGQIS
jgi:hypothetical protein